MAPMLSEAKPQCAIFVEGIMKNISVKLISIRTSDSEGDVV